MDKLSFLVFLAVLFTFGCSGRLGEPSLKPKGSRDAQLSLNDRQPGSVSSSKSSGDMSQHAKPPKELDQPAELPKEISLSRPKEISFQDFIDLSMFSQVSHLVISDDKSFVRVYLKATASLFKQFRIYRNKKKVLVKVPEVSRYDNPDGQLCFSIGTLEMFETQLKKSQDLHQKNIPLDMRKYIPIYYESNSMPLSESVFLLGLFFMFSQILAALLPILFSSVVNGGMSSKWAESMKSIGEQISEKMGKKDSISAPEPIPRSKLDKTFSNLKGIDNAIIQLRGIVDYLAHPDIYQIYGAKMPKSAILYGPPGTGKTSLAKALANETNINLFAASGSEFSQRYLGDGGKYVRELFKKASELAPSIIFIDEIDTIAKERGGPNRHSENDATLNELLSQMDGIGADSRVFVLGATNLLDTLDPAILRPGRLTRHIYVGTANIHGRADLFKEYLGTAKLDPAQNIEDLSKKLSTYTPSMSGDGVRSVVNEAALAACLRRNHGDHAQQYVTEADLIDAIDKVCYGAEQSASQYTDTEKLIHSYRQTGYALMTIKYSRENSSHSTQSLYPRSIPFKDASYYYSMTEHELLGEMSLMLSGPLSEQIFHNYSKDKAEKWELAASYRENLNKARVITQVYDKSFGRPLGAEQPLGVASSNQIMPIQIYRVCEWMHIYASVIQDFAKMLYTNVDHRFNLNALKERIDMIDKHRNAFQLVSLIQSGLYTKDPDTLPDDISGWTDIGVIKKFLSDPHQSENDKMNHIKVFMVIDIVDIIAHDVLTDKNNKWEYSETLKKLRKEELKELFKILGKNEDIDAINADLNQKLNDINKLVSDTSALTRMTMDNIENTSE